MLVLLAAPSRFPALCNERRLCVAQWPGLLCSPFGLFSWETQLIYCIFFLCRPVLSVHEASEATQEGFACIKMSSASLSPLIAVIRIEALPACLQSGISEPSLQSIN